MTIEKILNKKTYNDASNNNTYMIRKFNTTGWFADELTIVKDVSLSYITIYRCLDGKKYNIIEEDLSLFKLL